MMHGATSKGFDLIKAQSLLKFCGTNAENCVGLRAICEGFENLWVKMDENITPCNKHSLQHTTNERTGCHRRGSGRLHRARSTCKAAWCNSMLWPPHALSVKCENVLELGCTRPLVQTTSLARFLSKAPVLSSVPQPAKMQTNQLWLNVWDVVAGFILNSSFFETPSLSPWVQSPIFWRMSFPMPSKNHETYCTTHRQGQPSQVAILQVPAVRSLTIPSPHKSLRLFAQGVRSLGLWHTACVGFGEVTHRRNPPHCFYDVRPRMFPYCLSLQCWSGLFFNLGCSVQHWIIQTLALVIPSSTSFFSTHIWYDSN